jgi:hypothetical protein
MGTILLWAAVVLLAASVGLLVRRQTDLEKDHSALRYWAERVHDPEHFRNPAPDPEADALLRDCEDDGGFHVPVEGGKSCQNCRAVLA